MRTRLFWRLIASLTCSIGCGSAASTTPAASNAGGTPTSPGGETAHMEHAGHEHRFPAGPVTDFHEVLRPVWHSPEGPDRLTNACAASANLLRHAQAIVAGAVPEAARANEAGWRTAATSLQTDTQALVTECGTPQHASVADRLATLHTSFHRLIELLPH